MSDGLYYLIDRVENKVRQKRVEMTADEANTKNAELEAAGDPARWELCKPISTLIKKYKDDGKLKIK